jgi:hypothetical protein
VRFTARNAARFGRKGGASTFARHGRAHMKEIGRRRFTATCERRFGGDRRAMLNDLIRRGLAALDPAQWNRAWQNYQAFPAPLEESPF